MTLEEDNGKAIHKLSLGVRLLIAYSLVNMIICLIISGLITYKVAPEAYIGKTDRLSVVGSVLTGATNSLGLSILLFVLTQLVIVVIYVALRNKRTIHDERNFTISDSGAQGTARWMSKKEEHDILWVGNIANTYETIIGEDIDTGEVLTRKANTFLNKNTFICASPARGKSYSQIIPNILQSVLREESFCVTDPKGEIYSKTSKIAEKYGYMVRVLNLVNPVYSDACNFLSVVHGDTLLAQTISNIIIENTNSGKPASEYWINGEQALLTASILYLSTNTAETCTLSRLYEFVAGNTSTVLDSTFNGLPNGHPAKLAYFPIAGEKDDSKKSFKSGLGGRLQVFQDKTIASMTNYNDISFTAPGQQKCAYYIIMSDQESTLDFLAALFFSLFFILIVRYADGTSMQRCDVPVTLYLDEFPNIAAIQDFSKKINTVRSRGIGITMVAQDLGQMKDRYPGSLWNSILGSCDTNILLGTNDPTLTGKFYSEKSGPATIELQQISKTKKTFSTNVIIPQYNESVKYAARNLIMPDECCRLKFREEQYVFLAGQQVLKCRPFNLEKHPLWKEREISNPINHIPEWWQREGRVSGESFYNWSINTPIPKGTSRSVQNVVPDSEENNNRKVIINKVKQQSVRKKSTDKIDNRAAASIKDQADKNQGTLSSMGMNIPVDETLINTGRIRRSDTLSDSDF